MSHSFSVNRGFSPQLFFQYLILMALVLLGVGFASPSFAAPRLYSVEIGVAENLRNVAPALRPTWNHDVNKDLTISALPLPVFYITFEEGESFRFIVPASLFSGAEEFGSLGSSEYMYKLTYVDGRFVYPTIPIPNKLLRVRDALLAGEKYWNDAILRTDLQFELRHPENPIDVFISHFSEETFSEMGAYANFYQQEIRIPQRISDRNVETTTLHELFHFATYAELQTVIGDRSAHLDWDSNSETRARLFLLESTARWSEDEPITVPPGPGRNAPYKSDQANRYRCSEFIRSYQTDLFERSQYCAGLLMKFYTEQIAGGVDDARPEVILNLIARAYRLNQEGLTRAGWIQALAEGLPIERYPGANWEERWQKFYTDFSATLVVQNAALADVESNGTLGLHDDGLARVTRRPIGFESWPRHFADYLGVPFQAWQTPAKNDTERSLRLATIAQTVELPPNSSAHYRVDATREYGPSIEQRSVFLYAFGIPGTNTFALRRSEPQAYFGVYSPFKRLDGFEISRNNEETTVEQMGLGTDQANEDIFYLGLVNSGSQQIQRQMQWSYLISPRIVGIVGETALRPTPVHLVAGSAFERENESQFYNGDSFVFDTLVTSRVHARGARWQDIPRDQRTIDLELICEGSDQPVSVSGDSRDGSMRVDVSEVKSGRNNRAPTYQYVFSGTIDVDNTITGECVARVQLSSLLNLGGGDSQVDENFTFRLTDARPNVTRFQVTSNGAIVYDSRDNSLQAAKPENGAYTLGLKVWFATELSENGASILAGVKRPYEDYEVPVDDNFSDVPIWSIWFPPSRPTVTASTLETEITILESDVPGGGFLYFSIMANSVANISLDSDFVTPGDQRDTKHYAVLDIDDYYLATVSTELETQFSLTNLNGLGLIDQNQTIHFLPLESQFILKYISPDQPQAGSAAHDWTLIIPQDSLLRWQNSLEEVSDALAAQQNEHAELVNSLDAAIEAGAENNADRNQASAHEAIIRDALEKLEQEIQSLSEAKRRSQVLDSDFRLMLRLFRGARSYSCDEQSVDAVRARFGGMYSYYYYNSTVPGLPFFAELSAEMSMPEWSAEDVSQDLVSFYRVCPYITVWNYELSDLTRAKEIIADPPELSQETGFEKAIADQFQDLVNRLSELGWRFSQQSFDAQVDSGIPVGREINIRDSGTKNSDLPPMGSFPELVDGPLMRVFYQPNLWEQPWDQPIDRGTGSFVGKNEDDVFSGDLEFFYDDDGIQVEGTEESGLLSNTVPYVRNVGFFHLTRGLPILNLWYPGVQRSITWELEDSPFPHISSLTHRSRLLSSPPENLGLAIIGVATNNRLSGSIRGESPTFYHGGVFDFERWEDEIGDGEITSTHLTSNRFRWSIERNAVLGGDFPWPLKTVEISQRVEPDPNAEGNQQPVENNPRNADNPDNQAPKVPPTDNIDERPGGRPASATIVQPMIQYPGVVQGIITSNESLYKPGHVTIYLEGENLPPLDDEPLKMELNAGFPQEFVGISLGGSIRFHNGEAKGGPQYYIFTDSELTQIDHVIYPNEEVVIPFPQQGRLKVRNNNNNAHVLDVAVLPSTRFNVLETSSYIIREVPLGTYRLTAIAENRHYQPYTAVIEISATGRLQHDIHLIERGALFGGLAAE